jgi:hypothetical protein
VSAVSALMFTVDGSADDAVEARAVPEHEAQVGELLAYATEDRGQWRCFRGDDRWSSARVQDKAAAVRWVRDYATRVLRARGAVLEVRFSTVDGEPR